jgi:chromosome segregation ATPase
MANAQQQAIEANEAALDEANTTIDIHANIIVKTQRRALDNATEIDLLKAGVVGDADRFNSVEAKVYQTSDLLQKAEQTVAGNVSKITSNSEQIETQQKQLNTVSQSVSENQRRIERNTASISENTVAIANVQTGIERVALDVSDLAHGLAISNRQIDQNTAGIAIANALAGSTWLQSNESMAVSLNAGYFDGQSAIALTGAARLHEKWSANFAIGSDPSQGNIGARAGLRLGW